MPTLDKLIKTIKEDAPRERYRKSLGLINLRRNKQKVDFDMVKLAYDFAAEAHKDQKRKSGVPYINHCLETAIQLAKMGMDQETIIAGLLHDVPEDTSYSLVDIEKNFGGEVARMVAGITKLSVIKYRGIERYAENLRKMFISMAQDIRIIVIKMADRLHNLKTLKHLSEEKRERIAKESLEIYAPIADRLGMGQIKGEIEDLAFPFVYPEEHTWMKKEIIPKIELRMEYIQKVIQAVNAELKDTKIKINDIQGRPKRLYSLYRKLIKPHYNRDVTKIYDLAAVRIVVPTVADCYNVLGKIHQIWKPLPGRIKDYIAQPKPNGYQSLHTTVFCIEGKMAEIQIRTQEMHDLAEYGIAAHWHYKESKTNPKKIGQPGYTLPRKMQWIQDLVNWQKEISDDQQYLKTLTVDVFQNRIFVFTPKGDVIDLPEAATPVDFAYSVHTYIGDHCAGAKINNQIATLETQLKDGDVVEIITDKNRKSPSRDWLRFVKTGGARNKIKAQAKRY